MAGNARRTLVRGVRGHVWAPQTKVRRPDRLARYVARRSRAPYLRRWALLIALASRGVLLRAVRIGEAARDDDDERGLQQEALEVRVEAEERQAREVHLVNGNPSRRLERGHALAREDDGEQREQRGAGAEEDAERQPHAAAHDEPAEHEEGSGRGGEPGEQRYAPTRPGLDGERLVEEDRLERLAVHGEEGHEGQRPQ